MLRRNPLFFEVSLPFCLFHRVCGSFDPVPVAACLSPSQPLSHDGHTWLPCVHVAFYCLRNAFSTRFVRVPSLLLFHPFLLSRLAHCVSMGREREGDFLAQLALPLQRLRRTNRSFFSLQGSRQISTFPRRCFHVATMILLPSLPARRPVTAQQYMKITFFFLILSIRVRSTRGKEEFNDFQAKMSND